MRAAIDEIESRLPRWLAESDTPGASIALIGGRQVVWARGFGSKDVRSGEPVSAATVFEAASLSKPPFAHLVLQLCQSGRLNLDVPLWHYRDYPDLVHEPRARALTARHVLSHTSGLPNWRTAREGLRFICDPGERFTYSGEAFVYLQLVVERLTESPLGELMRKSVLTPLNLQASGYIWRDAFDRDVALGHGADGAPIAKRRPRRGNAAWSLHTTATEFATFMTSFLEDEGKLLMRSWLREALSPQMAVNRDLSWGLGWGLSGPEGRDSFWHWGSNPGYRCFAAASRGTGDGVVVLTNHVNGIAVCREVVRVALGGDHPAFAWSKLDEP
jgi:CubicO group peptidase (beta-lactamase class C family)